MSEDIRAFVHDKLRHEPRDLRLFELAFTHASAGNANYERLEFLGDRVLGMVIAEALYQRYPNEPEGNLSKRLNGREIGVPTLLRLGKQAREDGASQSGNVVGDVVEALIGALFLDGGMDAAKDFILNLWEPDLASQRRAPQHPKSALQELAAAKGVKAPVYEVVSRTGAHHAPKFTVRVSVAKLGQATAEGASKQEAETSAAASLLSQLQ
jgi:ribonuclease-3